MRAWSCALVLPPLGVPAIHLLDQIELAALLLGGNGAVADVGDQLVDLRELRVDIGSLVTAGQKGRLPVFGILDRVAARAEHDERRQVLIFSPQPVGEPRADARPRQRGVAAVHQHQRRFVIGNVGVHRADHAQLVGVLPQVREQLADLDAALTILLELERGSEGGSRLPLGPQVFVGQLLAVVAGQNRLGVERVDVRRTAVQEDVNDVLGTGRELWRFGSQRILELHRAGRRRPHQRRQAEDSHSQARLHEHFSTRAKGPVGLGRERREKSINHGDRRP